MPEADPRYCDVALPVPLDRLFTYELPLTSRHRVQVGSRVWAPFGSRRLTGVVLRAHNEPPEQETREILTLIDEEPVLDSELLRLAHWIAEYYCAPIGEVLKGMLPLSGEMRRAKRYSLTTLGRDVARQLSVQPPTDAASAVLRALDERSRSAAYLASKIENAQDRLARTCETRLGDARKKRRKIAIRCVRPPNALQAEFLRRPEPRSEAKEERTRVAVFPRTASRSAQSGGSFGKNQEGERNRPRACPAKN